MPNWTPAFHADSLLALLHWAANLCLSNLKRLQHDLIQHIPAFPDVKDPVHRHVAELLPQARNWPPDLDLLDRRSLAHTDMLAHRIVAKAGD